jgi:LacI family transcriptional regulator
MVTSRDVARVAGVSQATVSRVLSDNPLVTDATKQKVRDAIRAIGYVPDLRARAMKTSRSGNIGVVVTELSNPYFSEVIEVLDRSLSAHGYRVNVWVTGQSDRSEAESAALRAIRERSVDGVIFTAITPDLPELREAREKGSPVVLMNRRAPGLEFDAVVSDNVRGGEVVARLLVENAREQLAFIGGSPTASTASDRLEGYARELRAQGVVLPSARVVLGTYSYQFGFDAMSRLLEENDGIDAVFCSNDILAFGALDAARAHGLAVPDDLWVVGYDDVRMSAWRCFDLTTVRLDTKLLADEATRLLTQRLQDPARPAEVVSLSPELVIRGSAPLM